MLGKFGIMMTTPRLPCIYDPSISSPWNLGGVHNSPVGDGPISTGFAVIDADHPTPHTGIDLPAPLGTPIKVLLPGVLYAKGFDLQGVGNWAVTRHDAGDGSSPLHLMHGHMADQSPITWGSNIFVGDVIGNVGLTGKTTGPHLHWGCAPGNINPYVQVGPGKVIWNPLDHFVLPVITTNDLLSYLASGGLYVDMGESTEINDTRLIKILYPIKTQLPEQIS